MIVEVVIEIYMGLGESFIEEVIFGLEFDVWSSLLESLEREYWMCKV